MQQANEVSIQRAEGRRISDSFLIVDSKADHLKPIQGREGEPVVKRSESQARGVWGALRLRFAFAFDSKKKAFQL